MVKKSLISFYILSLVLCLLNIVVDYFLKTKMANVFLSIVFFAFFLLSGFIYAVVYIIYNKFNFIHKYAKINWDYLNYLLVFVYTLVMGVIILFYTLYCDNSQTTMICNITFIALFAIIWIIYCAMDLKQLIKNRKVK